MLSKNSRILKIFSYNGLHILLTEDNEINRQLAREILEAEGIIVDIAVNGMEALEMVTSKGQQYDLVLMDIQMPDMDGYEATRCIRSDPLYADLPIIAMTANALAKEREKSRNAGMNAHITKPINLDELFSALATWINIEKPVTSPAQSTTQVIPEVKKNTLPEHLPDISLQTGLKFSSSCNAELYRDLLATFLESRSEAAEEIRTMIQRGDMQTAARTAHTLKSVAGSIGATGLSMAAAALEEKIVAVDDGSLNEQLNNFSLHLDSAISCLSVYFREKMTKGIVRETNQIEHDAVKELVHE